MILSCSNYLPWVNFLTGRIHRWGQITWKLKENRNWCFILHTIQHLYTVYELVCWLWLINFVLTNIYLSIITVTIYKRWDYSSIMTNIWCIDDEDFNLNNDKKIYQFQIHVIHSTILLYISSLFFNLII